MAPLKNTSVLIVEDCPDTALSTALMLNLWGIRSVIAYDGKSALQQVENERPDVILLDLWLPDMSGVQVVQKLRQRQVLREVALVVLSGSATAKDHAELRKIGRHKHLTKPVEPDALHSVLTTYLQEIGPMDPPSLAQILTDLNAAADVLEAFENRALQMERNWNFHGWRYELIPWGVRFIHRDGDKNETEVFATLSTPTSVVAKTRGARAASHYFAETALEIE